MANIELIKVLRDRTGAGIMDCKNALVECNDDIDKAVDWLRKKGIAKQAKKADRIAAEGLTTVAVCESCGKASVVEINCETDFVSNSDPFKALVKTTADAALKNEPKDVEALKALVESEFTDAAVKLGEKLSLRRFEIVNPGEGEAIGYYIHQGGRISVITLLKTRDDELAGGFKKADLGKDINFMVVHKSCVLQYSKHTVNKVISPELNQDSDGWLFFYRAYGLADVYENKSAGIYLHYKE